MENKDQDILIQSNKLWLERDKRVTAPFCKSEKWQATYLCIEKLLLLSSYTWIPIMKPLCNLETAYMPLILKKVSKMFFQLSRLINIHSGTLKAISDITKWYNYHWKQFWHGNALDEYCSTESKHCKGMTRFLYDWSKEVELISHASH